MTELPPITSGHPDAAPVGVSIDDLLPGRSLLVMRVGVDRVAIRVSYEISPPVPPIGDPDRTACVAWLLNARDEAGCEYTDSGGAFGASPDGTVTGGVQSLRPVPPPETTGCAMTASVALQTAAISISDFVPSTKVVNMCASAVSDRLP